MPNIKSAKKRVKVIAARTERNKAVKSNLKTVIKKAQTALNSNAEDRVAAVQYATKRIDQAVSKGVLHKNTAARRKSALAAKLNQVG